MLYLAQQPSEALNRMVFFFVNRVPPLSGPWLTATFLVDLVAGLLGKLGQQVLGLSSERT